MRTHLAADAKRKTPKAACVEDACSKTLSSDNITPAVVAVKFCITNVLSATIVKRWFVTNRGLGRACSPLRHPPAL